jgi:hypothetical protein
MRFRRKVSPFVLAFSRLAAVVAVHAVSSLDDAALATTGGTVAGTVFLDKDSDGTTDVGEVGVASVEVKAYDSAGALVDSTTIGSDGKYSLTVSASASTQVRVEFTTPNGYQSSFAGANSGASVQFVSVPATAVDYALNIPGNYCADNVADPMVITNCQLPGKATKAGAGKNTAKDSSTGSATSRNMTTDGDRDPTLDFGFYKPTVSVGNFVWRDTNGDGVQSKADKGVAGFRLTLRTVDGEPVIDAYGRPVKPIRTKSDGKFLFKDLPEGRYVVEIMYPRGYLPTTPGRPDRGLNSSTLTAVSKALTDGQSDVTLDLGVVKRSGEVYRLLPATR